MIINAILVPQGAEYQAVCKGLKKVSDVIPPVFATPAGVLPISRYLERWSQEGHFSSSSPNILLMGLCGSLSLSYSVGEVVGYESCVYSGAVSCTDEALKGWVQRQLHDRVKWVKGVTCDRVISTQNEKLALGTRYNAQVVDMEGYAVLNVLHRFNMNIAILRVISDDCSHDLPNLTAAYNEEGVLQPFPLALAFLQQPIAATRLISGAMQSLRVLERVTQELFRGAE